MSTGSIVVTGANRGIGLELCRQLHARGGAVVAVCRESSAQLGALGVRVESGLDVASDDVASALNERLGDVPVDLLINNAGILRHNGHGDPDWDGMRAQFEVNALGPLRVTLALLPNLKKGAKVAMVTSRMGSISDNSSGGSYGYRASKAALNMISVSLAHDLRAKEIAVAILHPGYVRTRMTQNSGHMDPSESAALLIQRIDALTMQTSGTFWHANGEVLPW
jgi:NAD(P)-dependent dehydrogenase (short-subunit alcohol dehydrogenase family)